MKVKIKLLSPQATIPQYQHNGDAGVDLCNSGKEVTLNPGERKLIPTGIKIEIPCGYELQIRPRSGLALKKGITVLNTPGTIDSTYRGEIGIILFNSGKEKVIIGEKERIAQGVLNKVEKIEWEVAKDLNETTRNEGGFGSTDGD